MSIIEAKRRLRERADRARERAADESARAAACVADRFLACFQAVLDAEPRPVVSAYWPMGEELDVRPLLTALAARGNPCALPVVAGKVEALVFRRWRPGDGLAPGPFGTSEPGAGAEAVTPGIVVVPLLAFDRAGNRLGYGAGFYDRTLAALRARGPVLAVGVAFDAQEVDAVPVAAGDQPLDRVVTETRSLRCRGEMV